MALSARSALTVLAQVTGRISVTSGQEFTLPSMVSLAGLTDDEVDIVAYSTSWTAASGDKDVTGLAAAGFTAIGGDDATGMVLVGAILWPVDEDCDYQIADGSSNGYSTTIGTHDIRWGQAPLVVPKREVAVVVDATHKTFAITKTAGILGIVLLWQTP